MNEVRDRLEEFLDYKGISKSEFGRTIGVSSAYITSMRKSMQPDKIARVVLNYPELNTTWLLTGAGVMLNLEQNGNTNNMVVGDKNNIGEINTEVGRSGNTTTTNNYAGESCATTDKLLAMLADKDKQIDRLIATQEELIKQLLNK